MKNSGAYRCFILIFIFLTSGTVNIGVYPMGKATWLGALLGVIPAVLAYRFFIYLTHGLSGGLRYRAASLLFGAYTVFAAAGILGGISVFITTSNDFVISPYFITAMGAVTGIYLASLRGAGLERCTDLGFAWSAILLGIYFISGFDVWDAERLLPLFGGENVNALSGFFETFLFVFARGLAALWYLRDRADEKDIKKGASWAAVCTGLVISFSGVKNICTAGFELVSKYHFPVYAVCGVQYLWSYGLHIEDALVCAFMTLHIIKLALCFRISAEGFADAFGLRRRKIHIAAAGAFSLIWGLFTFAEGAGLEKRLVYDRFSVLFICLFALLFMGKPGLFWGGNTKTGKNDNMLS